MTTDTARLKTFRVTAIEWLSHTAVIEAKDSAAAEAAARELWAENCEGGHFRFQDCGLDGIVVDEN